jgi:cbb3-type cytochrome oxidase maturation protein
MSIIVLLIIASIAVAAGFLALFLWAVKDGQYDDDTTPAIRILFDDDKRRSRGKSDGAGTPR